MALPPLNNLALLMLTAPTTSTATFAWTSSIALKTGKAHLTLGNNARNSFTGTTRTSAAAFTQIAIRMTRTTKTAAKFNSLTSKENHFLISSYNQPMEDASKKAVQLSCQSRENL